MARELRHLLLTTTENPFDAKAWSGIPYSLRTALEECVDRVTVLPITKPRRTPFAVAQRVLFGARKYPLWISKPALQNNARQVRSAVAKHKPDAVLSISSSPILMFEQATVPMFLFSDAPYLTFAETYARWDIFPKRLEEFGKQEAALAQRLSGLCFGSGWACEEAQRQYAMSSADADRKLHITPLGANFQPDHKEDVEGCIEARGTREIQLLFVGRDWERKGGPLAVQVAEMIHAKGMPVRLHIVGCRPDISADFVTVHGLLRRDVAEERAKLEQLYLKSHFLITPTLAECFGIVFAEALAFGLPAVSRAVDAVPSIVLDGQTGLLCPPDAPAEAYVTRILDVFMDHPRYILMARSARNRFLNSLTWEHCARSIKAAVSDSLA